tara:strand:+ start:440 stop:685 length:246 start_codon:yes stop_codon:yes gene_type:complete
MTYQDFLDENLSRYNIIKSTDDWIKGMSDKNIVSLAEEREFDVKIWSVEELREMLCSDIAADKLERREKKKRKWQNEEEAG